MVQKLLEKSLIMVVLLNRNYPQNPNDNVYLFATGMLMGDSATQLWTSSPQQLL